MIEVGVLLILRVSFLPTCLLLLSNVSIDVLLLLLTFVISFLISISFNKSFISLLDNFVLKLLLKLFIKLLLNLLVVLFILPPDNDTISLGTLNKYKFLIALFIFFISVSKSVICVLIFRNVDILK